MIEHCSKENTKITHTVSTDESFNTTFPINNNENSQTFENEVTGVNGTKKAAQARVTEKEQNNKERSAVKFRQIANENILKLANRMISRLNKKLELLAIRNNVSIGKIINENVIIIQQ